MSSPERGTMDRESRHEVETLVRRWAYRRVQSDESIVPSAPIALRGRFPEADFDVVVDETMVDLYEIDPRYHDVLYLGEVSTTHEIAAVRYGVSPTTFGRIREAALAAVTMGVRIRARASISPPSQPTGST